MKKYVKAVIAATLAAIAIIIVLGVARKVSRKAEAREIISLVVTNREKIAELVTYRYSRDTVLFEVGKPSGLMAYLTPGPDTLAVFIARPTICAGVDLRKLRAEDFRVDSDTLRVSLPAPEILDLYLNHSDITQVYAAKSWKLDDKLGQVAERAKGGLQRDALRQGILGKAGAQAERSLSEFLSRVCGMPVVAQCAQPDAILPKTDIK